MALSQPGAGYRHRANIKDQYIRDALDDIISQHQAVVNQGNFSNTGVTLPPSTPVAVTVVLKNGLYTATINHPKAPVGTRWVLQYSPSPIFTDPISVDLGESPIWQNYLPNQTLYFRAAAKFLTSEKSPWIYLGSAASPLAAK
jgi:hypothetical protein